MFDFIGWSELLVIAVVAIIVVGPRELPSLLRTIGKTMGQLKRTADDFRSQFDEALKETELDQLKNQFEETAAEIKNPMTDFEKSVKDDFEEIDRSFQEDEPEESDKKSVAERAKDAAEAHAEHDDASDLADDDDDLASGDNVTPLHKQAS